MKPHSALIILALALAGAGCASPGVREDAPPETVVGQAEEKAAEKSRRQQGRIGERVESRVDEETDQAVDSVLDRALEKIFN